MKSSLILYGYRLCPRPRAPWLTAIRSPGMPFNGRHAPDPCKYMDHLLIYPPLRDGRLSWPVLHSNRNTQEDEDECFFIRETILPRTALANFGQLNISVIFNIRNFIRTDRNAANKRYMIKHEKKEPKMQKGMIIT